MSFNPDPSKQAQNVIFSTKLQMSTHPKLSFNNNTVTESVTQKHLGMLLNTKLDFQEHLKSLLKKVNKTIGLLLKLHNTLPRLLFAYNLQVIYKTQLWGYHIRSGIQRFISPKIRIHPIQLSSSYSGHYKRDIYRETL